jgi:hypothetical protein
MNPPPLPRLKGRWSGPTRQAQGRGGTARSRGPATLPPHQRADWISSISLNSMRPHEVTIAVNVRGTQGSCLAHVEQPCRLGLKKDESVTTAVQLDYETILLAPARHRGR